MSYTFLHLSRNTPEFETSLSKSQKLGTSIMGRGLVAASLCLVLAGCGYLEEWQREQQSNAKLDKQAEQLNAKQELAKAAAASKAEADVKNKVESLALKERALQHQKSVLQSQLADAERRVNDLNNQREKILTRIRSGDGAAFEASAVEGIKMHTETLPRAEFKVLEIKSKISDIDQQLTALFEEQMKR